ncbi:hypothetical protein HNR46_000191 [Haloferula luteola]|uniref:Uncharacterized protein n=1 Tax=Haloferula luteola TaxID=595692 RepID=A0A840V7N8_9BACT|nr:hypothetical protein [Haloferula luteola]MBB5349970.1 hypothetical protein [Haloferula luteola]
MAKSDYIEQGNPSFSTQLLTFKNALGSYGVTLGLSEADMTQHGADADYLAYLLERDEVLKNASRQSSAWTRLIRQGGTPTSGAPVAPVLPVEVPAVGPGIEERFRALVRRIKAHPAYSEAIGLALGIEGSQTTGPELATLAPVLKLTVAGGKVEIAWGWQGYGSHLDMIEILVDRGSGFGPLTFDTTPGYTDTASFPATPTRWAYKAIYHQGDSPVGQWSSEVSVIVGG